MTAVGQSRSKGARIGFSALGWIGRNRLAAARQGGAGAAAAFLDPAPDARSSSSELAPEVHGGTTRQLLAEPPDAWGGRIAVCGGAA